MAPTYKVSYFDITALGEPLRFILSYGGIEFEDERIEKERWPSVKPTMPFGQLPIMEHDGKIAHQSIAISRYLAKQVHLAGKDDWEDLEIDAAVDTVNDFRRKIAIDYYEADEASKPAKKEALLNQILPFYLEKLDDQAKLNNGYLAVGRLTWADLYFVSILDYLNFILDRDIIADFPNLKAVRETVLEQPGLRNAHLIFIKCT